jgi:acetyltransferase-like isoleucine patch superfamily enzyme
MVGNSARTKHEGGVRKYLNRSPLQRIRQLVLTRNIKAIGADVFVEKNVQFLRHPEKMSVGAMVIIKEGARLCVTKPDASLTIGDWTTIGYHTFIFANSSIEIGKNCLIAPFCYLVDTNHGFREGQLIREQPMSSSPIRLGDDVWLGAGVTVLRGVSIGAGAVVGAGSVVSEDIEENAIVSGNPAVVTDYRN